MKKIFLISVLSALLLACLGVAVACSSGNAVIQLDTQDFVDIGIERQDGTWTFDPNVKKGSSKTYDVKLKDSYDAKTLKVYANGEEAQFVLSDTYDAALLSDWQIVGKVTFSNVKEDLKVTFACEEKEISFSFKGAEGYENSANKALLNDFKLDEQTTLLSAVENSYTYRTTYSALETSAGISLTGTKKNGYYAFDSYDSMGGLFASFISGSAGISNAHDYLTKEHNQYRIGVETYAIALQNEVVVDPDGLQIEQWTFSSESGNVIEFYGGEGAQEGEAWSSCAAYANNVGEVVLKLKAQAGVTLPDKIYINGVEQEFKNGQYSFAGKAPVDFIPDDQIEAHRGNQSALVSFEVRVALDMSEATGLYAFKVAAENPEVSINYLWNDPYYFDGENTVWMSANSYTVSFDLQNVDASFDYVITVKDGTNTITYDMNLLQPEFDDSGTFTCTTDDDTEIGGYYFTEKGKNITSIYEIQIGYTGTSGQMVEIDFA